MFKKFQEVTLIQSWDDKGTVSFEHAIVEACGKKQMTLRHIDGTMLGRNFLPTREQYSRAIVVPTSEFTETLALAHAEEILAYQRAHFARCLANKCGDAYDRSIRKDIAELHEPRVIQR